MRLVLIRLTTVTRSTLGILFDPVTFIGRWTTCERAWNDNKKGLSCIPTGEYLCKRTNSKKFGETFAIQNVKDREGILFHAGNTYLDSTGCILVGEEYQRFTKSSTKLWGISRSRVGFNRLLKYLDGINEFNLNVINHSDAEDVSSILSE